MYALQVFQVILLAPISTLSDVKQVAHTKIITSLHSLLFALLGTRFHLELMFS